MTVINALNDFIEVKQLGCLETKIYVTITEIRKQGINNFLKGVSCIRTRCVVHTCNPGEMEAEMWSSKIAKAT